MKVRRYEARTYRDALAMVRDDLGPDAVILATKELSRGGLFGLFSPGAVEIVAATEMPRSRRRDTSRRRTVGGAAAAQDIAARALSPRPPAAPATAEPAPARARPDARRDAGQRPPGSVAVAEPEPASPEAPPAGGRLDRLERGLLDIRKAMESLVAGTLAGASCPDLPLPLAGEYRRLVQRGVLEDCALELLRPLADELAQSPCSPAELSERVRGIVRDAVIASGPLLPQATTGNGRTRMVALVGPTGVGKTTTVAKLAAHYCLLEDRRVGLLTVDTYRVAAVDQLRTFAQIMSLPLEVASTPSEARMKLSALGAKDLILIDTAGRSQRARDRVDELCELMRALEPDEIHLVMSATTKPEDMVEIGREFGRLGVNRAIFTKIDETTTYGGMLSALRRSALPVSYLANGQKVPEDLEVASAELLADLICGKRRDGT
jgi:flagellar biosynthesis protein FlhF